MTLPNDQPDDDRQHDYDRWKVERRAELFSAHLAAVTSFGSVATRSVILANGAGAAAVLTMLGTAADTTYFARILDPAIEALWSFVLGAAAGVFTAFSSYFSQHCYGLGDIKRFDGNSWKPIYTIGTVGQVLAIMCAIYSLYGFIDGAAHGVDVLRAFKQAD